MPLETSDPRLRREIPELQRLIFAAGECGEAVGRNRDRADGSVVVVGDELRLFVPGAGVPQTQGVIGAAADESCSIIGKRDGKNGTVVAEKAAKQRSGHDVKGADHMVIARQERASPVL